MDIWIPCCWDSCDIKPHLSFNRINCRCYSQDFNDSRIVAGSKWCIASLLVTFHSNMRISIFFLGKINCFPNDTEIECRLMLIWTHKSIFTICVATRFYRFVINKREEKKTTMWLICSCSPIIIQIWSRREQKRCLTCVRWKLDAEHFIQPAIQIRIRIGFICVACSDRLDSGRLDFIPPLSQSSHSFICNLIFHNSTNIFHNIFNAHENEIIHTCTIYGYLFTETNYKHTGVNGNPRNGCSPFNRFLDGRFKGTIKNEKLHAYRSVRIGTSFYFSEKFVLQNSMAIFWVFFLLLLTSFECDWIKWRTAFEWECSIEHWQFHTNVYYKALEFT